MMRINSCQAFQYDGNYMNADRGNYFPWWAVDAFKSGIIYYYSINGEPLELFVTTPRGVCTISVGDYVIKDARGNLHTCKAEMFEQTYEKLGGVL